MAKSKAMLGPKVKKQLKGVIQAVRRLKDQVTGLKWTRLHRVESELGTVLGSKPVKRRKIGGKKKSGAKK